MRGLLVVNPNATTTTARVRDVLIHALADQFRLDVAHTDHRGHAAELGQLARHDSMDCVIVFGGDGTVNEVVNGMFGESGPGADVPTIGVVPGGSANVLSRALGNPVDPVEATGELIGALRDDRTRSIGLSRADERWFTVNAGLGIDAEIIRAMEEKRHKGKAATPSRYLRTTLRQFFDTDREEPSLIVERPGTEPEGDVFLAIVQNTSPWTYLGSKAINPSTHASFDTGLDLFALKSMSLTSGLRHGRRMITNSKARPTNDTIALHDQSEFTIRCIRPTAVQVDGEGMPDTASIRFTAHPNALNVFV